MSAIKLQLDTNFLLDALIEDRPQSDDALAAFEAIIDGVVLAQTMPSQLVDYCYSTRKAGLSDEERRRSISLFLDYLELCPVDSAFVRAVIDSDDAVQKVEPSALAEFLNLG